MKEYKIMAMGGTTWNIFKGSQFIRSEEFGDLDADGQYEQDDDEVIEYFADTLDGDVEIVSSI